MINPNLRYLNLTIPHQSITKRLKPILMNIFTGFTVKLKIISQSFHLIKHINIKNQIKLFLKHVYSQKKVKFMGQNVLSFNYAI